MPSDSLEVSATAPPHPAPCGPTPRSPIAEPAATSPLAHFSLTSRCPLTLPPSLTSRSFLAHFSLPAATSTLARPVCILGATPSERWEVRAVAGGGLEKRRMVCGGRMVVGVGETSTLAASRTQSAAERTTPQRVPHLVYATPGSGCAGWVPGWVRETTQHRQEPRAVANRWVDGRMSARSHLESRRGVSMRQRVRAGVEWPCQGISGRCVCFVESTHIDHLSRLSALGSSRQATTGSWRAHKGKAGAKG